MTANSFTLSMTAATVNLGKRLAFIRRVRCEVHMRYELIPLLIILAIPLLAGLALIVDALRRALHEAQGGKS